MKRKWIVGLALALIATACTDRGEPEPPRRELVAEVASYDLAVVIPGRFLVGLGTSGPEGQLFVSGGSVPLSLFYLGEDEATGREPYSGCDRLVPADTRLLGALPVCADPGAGFERTRCLFVREPGVPPAGDLGGRGDDGHRRRGPDGDLRVPSSSRACGACCRRPSAENLTLASKDAPHEAIDSRAATGEIPDPELHRTTVADSVAAGHPALVVISTPVYCVSR
ncbi:MAG: hypothetical protein ACRDKA_13830, partial [Actinomycetota bacterium]